MCLGGGGGDSYEPPRYLSRTDPPPGPAAGPDTVNDIPVSDTGNYNRDQMKAPTAKASGSQSSRSRGG